LPTKRLKSLIPLLIWTLERHGSLDRCSRLDVRGSAELPLPTAFADRFGNSSIISSIGGRARDGVAPHIEAECFGEA
jgi:hypothetical protein